MINITLNTLISLSTIGVISAISIVSDLLAASGVSLCHFSQPTASWVESILHFCWLPATTPFLTSCFYRKFVTVQIKVVVVVCKPLQLDCPGTPVHCLPQGYTSQYNAQQVSLGSNPQPSSVCEAAALNPEWWIIFYLFIPQKNYLYKELRSLSSWWVTHAFSFLPMFVPQWLRSQMCWRKDIQLVVIQQQTDVSKPPNTVAVHLRYPPRAT